MLDFSGLVSQGAWEARVGDVVARAASKGPARSGRPWSSSRWPVLSGHICMESELRPAGCRRRQTVLYGVSGVREAGFRKACWDRPKPALRGPRPAPPGCKRARIGANWLTLAGMKFSLIPGLRCRFKDLYRLPARPGPPRPGCTGLRPPTGMGRRLGTVLASPSLTMGGASSGQNCPDGRVRSGHFWPRPSLSGPVAAERPNLAAKFGHVEADKIVRRPDSPASL